ncbi:MAG TPA: T9SS type A sorting domain-containing protein, partial [Flavisolibacter sp.]|nr:T9SS type A sorting domain-containing protein [Flavisolibacter sp.]
AVSFLLLTSSYAQQPGDLDPGYGNGGITPGNAYSAFITSMVVQSDGKVIVRNDYNMNHTVLTRFTLNGALDSSFHNNGILEIKNFYGTYSDNLALQPDGKLLVPESRFGPEGYVNTDVFIRRYSASGRRDTAFGVEGVLRVDLSNKDADGNFNFTDDFLLSAAVQANGDIVLAILYYRNDDPETGYSAIVTCNRDGVITNIKKLPTQPGDFFEYTQVSAYRDGGYIFTTDAENFQGTYIYSTRFGQKVLSPVGGFTSNLKHHILENGKIAILNAQHFIGNGQTSSTFIRLLNADGSVDTNFSGDGVLSIAGSFGSISSQKDGKLLIGGEQSIIRLTPDGSLDASFGGDGKIALENQKVEVYGDRLYASAEENVAAILLSTTPRHVKVNLSGNTNPYLHGEWNNWNNLADRHFNNFYYSDSTASTIDAVMSNRNGVNDNGSNYGAAVTLMAPQGVLRHSSYSIASRTVTLSSLAPSKKYDLEFYASRNEHSGNSTIFTINGVAKSVSTYRNYTTKVLFSNLTPDAQGQIVISIKSSKDYNYLNGFVLTEKFNSTGSTEALVDNSAESRSIEETKTAPDALVVNVFPNPASAYFTLKLQSKNSEPVQLRMIDETGRVIEKRTVAANSAFTFGRAYKQGMYFIEMTQGTERKLVRVLKTR